MQWPVEGKYRTACNQMALCMRYTILISAGAILYRFQTPADQKGRDNDTSVCAQGFRGVIGKVTIEYGDEEKGPD
jgi:hypothetical protein